MKTKILLLFISVLFTCNDESSADNNSQNTTIENDINCSGDYSTDGVLLDINEEIYNNDKLFWGMPAEAECAIKGGHNPDTGFPFFEEFYLTLEEQKKDPDSWFKINNIEIYIKTKKNLNGLYNK